MQKLLQVLQVQLAGLWIRWRIGPNNELDYGVFGSCFGCPNESASINAMLGFFEFLDYTHADEVFDVAEGSIFADTRPGDGVIDVGRIGVFEEAWRHIWVGVG